MQTRTKQQKILLVITKSNWGGAQKYVYTLATAVNLDPHFAIEVVTGNTGELNERLTHSGVTTTCTPIHNTLHLRQFFSDIRLAYILLAEKQPDIVHSNSNKAGLVYAIAVTIYNATHRHHIQSIFTVHGHAFNEDRPYLVRTYLKLAESITFLFTHSIISVSKQVARDIPVSFFFKKKNHVIYNGIPSYTFLERHEAKERLGIADNSIPQFVTIAELHDTKNHLFVLRALTEYHKPYVYHIIGEGEMRPQILSFIEQHNLHHNVILHGHLQDAMLYLKAFDLFILPSKTEALPYVIQEAGQAGIRTIASRVGGIPELLPDPFLFSLRSTKELLNLLNRFTLLAPHTTYYSEKEMLDKTFALYRQHK